MPALLNATATRTRTTSAVGSRGQPVDDTQTTSASFACALQPISETEQLDLGRQRGQVFKTMFWKASSGVDIEIDDEVTVTAAYSDETDVYLVQSRARDEGGRGGRYLSVTLMLKD